MGKHEEKHPFYGSVSFSGVTDAGPFYEQIWSGRKRQTLREPKSNGIPHAKPGHAFNMYWRVRYPRDGKPVHFIGTALCTRYEAVDLNDYWADEGFAKRDGFQGLEDFHEWFVDPSKVLMLIEWNYPLLERGDYLTGNLMKCPWCGAVVPDNIAACWSCGRVVNDGIMKTVKAAGERRV